MKKVLILTLESSIHHTIEQSLLTERVNIVGHDSDTSLKNDLLIGDYQVIIIDLAYPNSLDIIQFIRSQKQTNEIGLIVILKTNQEWPQDGPSVHLVDDLLIHPLRPFDCLIRVRKLLTQSNSYTSGKDEQLNLFHKTPSYTLPMTQNNERLLRHVSVTLHHEIRNPLTSILIGSQALRVYFQDNNTPSRVIKEIEHCAQRIRKTLDTLGDLKEIVVDDYLNGIKMLNLTKSQNPSSFINRPFPGQQSHLK